MADKKHAGKTCFVIGPIGSAGSDERRHADMLLNAIIREVLERSGEFDYQVKRADEDADPGMINDRVIHDILNAELAIADLSFLNPNAFWELGLRHSAMKPVIHMAADGTKLPFDNIGHRAIFVDLGDWDSQQAARKALAKAAKTIESANYKVSNPITQANASFKLRDSSDTTDQLLVDLAARMRGLERRFEAGGLAHRYAHSAKALSEWWDSQASSASARKAVAGLLLRDSDLPATEFDLDVSAMAPPLEPDDDDS